MPNHQLESVNCDFSGSKNGFVSVAFPAYLCNTDVLMFTISAQTNEPPCLMLDKYRVHTTIVHWATGIRLRGQQKDK